MFWGKTFIFDNVPSETYNLGIINFDEGKINSPGGADIEIVTKQLYRKPKPLFFGTSQRPVLQFPLTIGTIDWLDGQTRSLIQKWLFGHKVYKKLQILETDLEDCYFYCFLTNSAPTYVGNMNTAYSCTVVCDAPWAWEPARTMTRTYTDDHYVTDSMNFYNSSADNDYLYPTVKFITNNIGSSFTLTNVTDASRQFIFTGISPIETITVDNYTQQMTSSTGLYRLSQFNKNWFRLLPGNNKLNWEGGMSNISITYQLAHKVGG